MNRSDNDLPSETELSDDEAPQPELFIAELVQAGESVDASQPQIRVGSPFRGNPTDGDLPIAVPVTEIEAAYGDYGPFLYTAMGASGAAVAVLLFAALGAWWFPTGGALVAVLGTILSIVGLFSTKKFRYAAITMLPLHMGLFFLSYIRSLS